MRGICNGQLILICFVVVGLDLPLRWRRSQALNNTRSSSTQIQHTRPTSQAAPRGRVWTPRRRLPRIDSLAYILSAPSIGRAPKPYLSRARTESALDGWTWARVELQPAKTRVEPIMGVC
ncbi:hypothetical protein B0H17DRAFT_1093052 [Mycena rosella]|uniref:Uncharacterized protein n=1 Tax=Mycena rosella TaxID=1033263 RepID=A0AAD7CTR7_MYCRO|nr:hypothetical protein B0H17DRAFT_1093052 [Mycena rosella]